jgi:disulfide bond formation protein DsbB
MPDVGLPGLLAANRRLVDVAAGMACFALVAFAIYAQQGLGLIPCPLCIFQRVALAALGVAFLLAAVPSDRQLALRRVATALIAIAALAGAGIAARHLWIQSQPAGSVAACGATLDYMMDVFPVTEVLRKVLTGSGECAKVDWTFLGLSMPGWVLVWAVGLGGLGVLANGRRGTA